jgi:hypothetical protein
MILCLEMLYFEGDFDLIIFSSDVKIQSLETNKIINKLKIQHKLWLRIWMKKIMAFEKSNLFFERLI